METIKVRGKILPSGYLSIPTETLENFGLFDGDEIEIIIKKRKLQTAPSSEKSEKKISFAKSKQKRLSDLLMKNREGKINAEELQELEELVFEAQLKTIEKARTLLEKRKTNSTIVSLDLKE